MESKVSDHVCNEKKPRRLFEMIFMPINTDATKIWTHHLKDAIDFCVFGFF